MNGSLVTAVSLSDTEIARRIDAVRTFWHWRRLERDGCLDDVGPESLKAVLRLVSRQRSDQRTREWIMSFLLLIPFSVLIAWIFHSALLFPVIVFLPGIAIDGIAKQFATVVQRRAIEILAHHEHPGLLDIMVDAYDLPGDRVKAVIDQSIARTLCNITSEQWFDVLDTTRKRIYDRSKHGSAELARAAIAVAESTDDIRALDAMRYFGDSRTSRISRDRAARQAARRVAELLKARVEEQQRTACLLRPVEQPGESQLLRPAGAPSTMTFDLLRPTSDSGEGIESDMVRSETSVN